MFDFTWLGIFAAFNVGIVTGLALNISFLRIKLRVANGDGGQRKLKQAIRAHGNGVEHVSMFSILVVAMTLTPNAAQLLPALVITFSIARLLHATSMLQSAFNLRRVAAALTYLSEISAVIWLAYILVT